MSRDVLGLPCARELERGRGVPRSSRRARPARGRECRVRTRARRAHVVRLRRELYVVLLDASVVQRARPRVCPRARTWPRRGTLVSSRSPCARPRTPRANRTSSPSRSSSGCHAPCASSRATGESATRLAPAPTPETPETPRVHSFGRCFRSLCAATRIDGLRCTRCRHLWSQRSRPDQTLAVPTWVEAEPRLADARVDPIGRACNPRGSNCPERGHVAFPVGRESGFVPTKCIGEISFVQVMVDAFSGAASTTTCACTEPATRRDTRACTRHSSRLPFLVEKTRLERAARDS